MERLSSYINIFSVSDCPVVPACFLDIINNPYPKIALAFKIAIAVLASWILLSITIL